MRFPKLDKAATATLIAASVVAIVGAFLLTHRWDGLTAASVETQAPITPDQRPVVDVVFALDTTGSMAGLIESAKQKVWSVANNIMSGQPRPIVRFGLVFYRDKSDAYLTESLPLTRDIDAVYERLLAAKASGGGDSPEHVNAALDIAINKMQWNEGDNVLKLVFLVGDAPPHDDYTDVPDSNALSVMAKSKGIIINTIRAGTNYQTELAWQRIATASSGAYASIAQDGGTVAVKTPFDAELERYNRELADSGIAFGTDSRRRAAEGRWATRKGMSGETAAAAASVTGRSGGYMGDGDLISGLDTGAVDLAALPESEAPAALRGKTLEQKRAWVAGKKAKRKELAEKAARLSAKRSKYIKAKAPAKADSFDKNVDDMLEKQTKKVGIKYKD